ncbi:MAG: acylphosphatase [Peptococcaceae bacterium]|nr:acylphosphatase [Peptococcaceae bacterium]
MSTVRAHFLVSGKVQGVYYRASTKKKALALGLVGWVRNCPDGSVEGVVEGDKDRVDDMLLWCKEGPRRSVVDDVAVDWESSTGKFKTFSVKPDKA